MCTDGPRELAFDPPTCRRHAGTFDVETGEQLDDQLVGHRFNFDLGSHLRAKHLGRAYLWQVSP